MFSNLGLQYNALGWVFIQIRELSWLQWHPFSVSSSPLDGKHHLAVLIKVLGDWTEKLRGHISSSSGEKDESHGLLHPNLSLKASIEGPYGHESPYHLTYVLYSFISRIITSYRYLHTIKGIYLLSSSIFYNVLKTNTFDICVISQFIH